MKQQIHVPAREGRAFEVDAGIVGVSACPQDQNPCNGFNPTDIGVEVLDAAR